MQEHSFDVLLRVGVSSTKDASVATAADTVPVGRSFEAIHPHQFNFTPWNPSQVKKRHFSSVYDTQSAMASPMMTRRLTPSILSIIIFIIIINNNNNYYYFILP